MQLCHIICLLVYSGSLLIFCLGHPVLLPSAKLLDNSNAEVIKQQDARLIDESRNVNDNDLLHGRHVISAHQGAKRLFRDLLGGERWLWPVLFGHHGDLLTDTGIISGSKPRPFLGPWSPEMSGMLDRLWTASSWAHRGNHLNLDNGFSLKLSSDEKDVIKSKGDKQSPKRHNSGFDQELGQTKSKPRGGIQVLDFELSLGPVSAAFGMSPSNRDSGFAEGETLHPFFRVFKLKTHRTNKKSKHSSKNKPSSDETEDKLRVGVTNRKEIKKIIANDVMPSRNHQDHVETDRLREVVEEPFDGVPTRPKLTENLGSKEATADGGFVFEAGAPGQNENAILSNERQEESVKHFRQQLTENGAFDRKKIAVGLEKNTIDENRPEMENSKITSKGVVKTIWKPVTHIKRQEERSKSPVKQTAFLPQPSAASFKESKISSQNVLDNIDRSQNNQKHVAGHSNTNIDFVPNGAQNLNEVRKMVDMSNPFGKSKYHNEDKKQSGKGETKEREDQHFNKIEQFANRYRPDRAENVIKSLDLPMYETGKKLTTHVDINKEIVHPVFKVTTDHLSPSGKKKDKLTSEGEISSKNNNRDEKSDELLGYHNPQKIKQEKPTSSSHKGEQLSKTINKFVLNPLDLGSETLKQEFHDKLSKHSDKLGIGSFMGEGHNILNDAFSINEDLKKLISENSQYRVGSEEKTTHRRVMRSVNIETETNQIRGNDDVVKHTDARVAERAEAKIANPPPITHENRTTLFSDAGSVANKKNKDVPSLKTVREDLARNLQNYSLLYVLVAKDKNAKANQTSHVTSVMKTKALKTPVTSSTTEAPKSEVAEEKSFGGGREWIGLVPLGRQRNASLVENEQREEHHRQMVVGALTVILFMCLVMAVVCAVGYTGNSRQDLHRINSRTNLYRPHQHY